MSRLQRLYAPIAGAAISGLVTRGSGATGGDWQLFGEVGGDGCVDDDGLNGERSRRTFLSMAA